MTVGGWGKRALFQVIADIWYKILCALGSDRFEDDKKGEYPSNGESSP